MWDVLAIGAAGIIFLTDATDRESIREMDHIFKYFRKKYVCHLLLASPSLIFLELFHLWKWHRLSVMKKCRYWNVIPETRKRVKCLSSAFLSRSLRKRVVTIKTIFSKHFILASKEIMRHKYYS
jgi:hypothetical protein